VTRPLRIANCSGFFGDRLAAAREMVDGGPIDVLTGDWLAELTMVILHKTRQRSGGYARTFLTAMDDVLATCVDRGIKVVSNAGGLDPAACAAAVRELADRHGLAVRVASVGGDDLVGRMGPLRAAGERFVNLDTGDELPPAADVVTANAYVGAAPIAAALAAGADVVVTGRVTDASLVVGPGIWAFGWGPDDLDELAGAVVAGHVIECGAQCCGGNYAFFDDVPGLDRVGFPLVELAADGSAVVTKHPGTGGMVTAGTVTAQLLYEIAGPRYLSPDAVARFDTVEVATDPTGADRVRISGVRGEPPPPDLKVAANLAGGWRNAVTLVLTGLETRAKADVAASTVWAAVPGGRDAFDETAVELSGDVDGPGVAYLRLAVRGDDEALVGRSFSAAAVETALASYPGEFYTGAPTPAQAVVRYWPTTVAAGAVRPVVDLDGQPVAVDDAWLTRPTAPAEPDLGAGEAGRGPTVAGSVTGAASVAGTVPFTNAPAADARVADEPDTIDVPLGVLVGARSGDKGGNANVGLWAESDDVFAWLLDAVDVDRFRALLPEIGDCPVDRYVLANLRAVNFVVHGILGWGVASNLRLDGQAKALGELVRARSVAVPRRLLAGDRVAATLARLAGPVPAVDNKVQ
jgi:Acyclic terpene utilisation family protein AtuA